MTRPKHRRKTKRRKPGKNQRKLARKLIQAGYTPAACREQAARSSREDLREQWAGVVHAVSWETTALRARRASARRRARRPAQQLDWTAGVSDA